MNRPRFHLAIPVRNLEETAAFYGGILGCPRGRSADTWIDWNVFGHQVVTHLHEGSGIDLYTSVDGHKVPVPHFGVILDPPTFHALAETLRNASCTFAIEPYVRFEGEPGEQWTMFLFDPSGNALEFKAFSHDDQVFAT
ncbi:MAG: glyoxalase [Acidimicrobiaceae bacterium]|nr:glyoxalase [Acidimicrobiaceae bacterium]|tara:strand:- start:1034 stop:1450 length:417 start_codon:yes stop_codon:yes gene_type:complete